MTIRRPLTLTIAFASVGVMLQACAPTPSGPSVRLFHSDFQGIAKTCATPKADMIPGKAVDVSMRVSSDAGWCGLTVNNGSRPFDTELLTARPAHGKIYAHIVGNDTRIDYTPDAGFVGTDTFTVKLLPGNAVVNVAVTAVAH